MISQNTVRMAPYITKCRKTLKKWFFLNCSKDTLRIRFIQSLKKRTNSRTWSEFQHRRYHMYFEAQAGTYSTYSCDDTGKVYSLYKNGQDFADLQVFVNIYILQFCYFLLLVLSYCMSKKFCPFCNSILVQLNNKVMLQINFPFPKSGFKKLHIFVSRSSRKYRKFKSCQLLSFKLLLYQATLQTALN